MLIKTISGLSVIGTGITVFSKFMTLPWYNLILITVLLFAAFFVGIVLAYVIILFVLTELTVDIKKPQDKPSKFWVKQLNLLAEAICTVCNIRVHATGFEKIPTDKRFLIVCNHRSMFDPIVKIPLLKDYNIIYASKAENFKIPVGGKIMHKTGCLVIDRENNREALKTINKMAENIANDKASACIYPEGTRNTKDKMLPFHAGSFKVAQKAGAPVVVISLRNTDKVSKNAPFKKTDVYIDVLKIIDGEFVKNNPTKATADIAQKLIQDKLDEAIKNETKETVSA